MLRPASSTCKGPEGRRRFLRRWTLPACATGLLAGCMMPPPPWSPPRVEPVLNPQAPAALIVSANVNLHGVEHQRTADALLATQGDVLFLQETTAAWEAYLESRPDIAGRYPVRRYRHDWSAGGQAVLSRWPVAERAWIPSPADLYPAWHVEVETPFGPLQVLAVHLAPPVTETGHWRFGVAVNSKADRRCEIRHYWETIGPDDAGPLIVLGDFNESTRGPAHRWLAANTDLEPAIDAFDRTTASWRWQVAGVIPMRRRVDHIFVSPELHVHAAGVYTGRGDGSGPEPGSDHRPVWALVGPAPAHDPL